MTNRNPTRFSIRPATAEDATDLANLITIAGDGLPLIVWETMREHGESTMDVGRRRAARPEGSFSYVNADLAVTDGGIASAIVSYPLPPDMEPEPVDDVPPIFQPLVALENAVIASWYINVLATYPDHRRTGTATALLAHVEERARTAGYERLSLITGDINPALGFYGRLGFGEMERAEIVKDGWDYAGTNWVLMTKPIG